MAASVDPVRPRVLLLAGDARDAWARDLAARGLDVATTGWLDGVTAARLRTPDVVVISTDLPDGAPAVVCSGFRSGSALAKIPLVVVGPGADAIEAVAIVRADRYVAATPGADALASAVRETIADGRLRPKTPRAALALAAVAGAAILTRCALLFTSLRSLESGAGILDLWAYVVFVAASIAAAAVAVAKRAPPYNAIERRRIVGHLGSWFYFAGVMAPSGSGATKLASISLVFLAWALWAWLGPRVRHRTRGAARSFQLLAGTLVLFAAAPWALWAWTRWS